MLTSFTEEIYDAADAVSEILKSLDAENNLLANSVGILHCASDFSESDVVSGLCARLPFDVLGCTTTGIQTRGVTSQLAVSLTVLTSDDVGFAAGVSGPVDDDPGGPVSDLYRRMISGRPRPALLIPFIPFMTGVGGDEFQRELDAQSGGLPAFGPLAISDEIDYEETYTIFNGEFYPASMALLALFGDVDPIFAFVSVDDDNILRQKAVITGISRNVLRTINNLPATEYLESIGLAENGDVSGLVSMPFVITPEDGTRLVRACIGSNEDGAVILCGSAPLGAVISITAMGSEYVIRSTEKKLSETLPLATGRSMLMYSCATRNWALGMKFLDEQKRVDECIGDSVPYSFAYSGGEIFPAFRSGGAVSNQLHNGALIICVL